MDEGSEAQRGEALSRNPHHGDYSVRVLFFSKAGKTVRFNFYKIKLVLILTLSLAIGEG